jgi:hypothetical protein
MICDVLSEGHTLGAVVPRQKQYAAYLLWYRVKIIKEEELIIIHTPSHCSNSGDTIVQSSDGQHWGYIGHTPPLTATHLYPWQHQIM